MATLFNDDDDSDKDEGFHINKNFAGRYEKWRKAEEIQKLKDKYGKNATRMLESEESSSETEDEHGEELTPEVEKDFLKTLSFLKRKDAGICNDSVQFFKEPKEVRIEKKKKEKPMYIRDYERKLILEKKGHVIDEEDTVENDEMTQPMYIKEQENIRASFREALKDTDEAEEGGEALVGGFLTSRKKTQAEIEEEEAQYIKWIKGQKEELEDKTLEEGMKDLKEYWNDPMLIQDEVFLRDYILNKKYKETEAEDYIPSYDEIVHDSDESLSEDEETVKKQELFEHKYNFRFEEPDEEFIKHYPRIIKSSLRKKDDKRKKQRQMLKGRKEQERLKLTEELKHLKALKKKEIMDKIKKLKEITGNDSIGFQNRDLEEDFDPEKHDQRMTDLFGEEYYSQYQFEESKPEVHDCEDLEVDNWDTWEGYEQTGEGGLEANSNIADEEVKLHCEDPDFNMDCDYDPKTQTQKEIMDSVRRKKQQKKSKFAKALERKKPKFDSSDKTFEKYFDEYYNLDYEDMIGDIPVRFKYRKTEANDYGLSTEEILYATDQELNKWCSLKKIVQYQSKEKEKYEVQAYKKNAKNLNRKKRILQSLYTMEPEETLELMAKKKKRKKKGKHKLAEDVSETDFSSTTKEKQCAGAESFYKEEDSYTPLSNSEVATDKSKESSLLQDENDLTEEKSFSYKHDTNKTQSQKKKKQKIGLQKNVGSIYVRKHKVKESQKHRNTKNKEIDIGISDVRLKGYGLNPTRYKKFVKFHKEKHT